MMSSTKNLKSKTLQFQKNPD